MMRPFACSRTHPPLLTPSETPCYYPQTMNKHLAAAFAKPVYPSTMGGCLTLTNGHIHRRAEVYKS